MRLNQLKIYRRIYQQGISTSSGEGKKSRIIRNISILFLSIIIVCAVWRAIHIYRYGFIGPVIFANGLVKANEVFISAKVDGTIIELPLEERDVVHKGETIVQLDNEEYLARVDEAEANLDVTLRENKVVLNETSRELENASKLHETEAMTSQNLALLQAKYELIVARCKASELKAKAALRQARAKLKETTILAPIEGVISWRLKQVGEVVQTGSDILVITEPSKLWLSAQIPESKIGLIQVGQKVKATMNAFPRKEYYGHIERISPRLRTVKGSWLEGLGTEEKILDVKIVFDETYPELKPGLLAKIKVYTQKMVKSKPQKQSSSK